MKILTGAVIIILGAVLFRKGLRYRDPGGTKISNVNIVGAATLLIIIGIAILFSKLPFCEIFSFLCK